MKPAGYAVALILIAVGLPSCQARLEPQQVADRFWRAVAAGDAGAARMFVTRVSRAAVDPAADVLPIGEAAFGRTVIDGPQARVQTTLTVLGDRPTPVTLATHLVEEDGTWKVDYTRSIQSVAGGSDLALALERMRELNSRFSAELDRSVEELQKRLPRIQQEMQRFQEELTRRVPAIRQELEDFARRLEEALHGPGEQPAAPADGEQPRAI